ncbi:hypothetical protein [Aquisphaera insulae]|uniref:hypothetical protein n=1 Tax=Aquisphaera insulae TaxID=2712864 RepID=UPI0013E9C179|nr:hypothetical protein [Aquisphaera insulae]
MTTLNPVQTTRPPVPPRRMTVVEYEELIESGVIDERAPVELIEGRIVGKRTRGRRHGVASSLIQDALTIALGSGSGWFVRVE